MKNKTLLSVSIATSVLTGAAPTLLTLNSCSCATKPIECINKERTTYGISKFPFKLDRDCSVNDLDVKISGEDSGKLDIKDIDVTNKVLTISIAPKITPLIETKYKFDLNVSKKGAWSYDFKDMALTYTFVDDEIKAHDENSWQHAIEHIATCKHPTIFIPTNASYFIQQAVHLYLSASQLAIQKGNVFSNPEYKYNDLIFIVPNMVWDYKNCKTIEGVTTFNYLYKYLVDSSFGYSDIIANSKTKGKSIVDPSEGNQMIVTNLQDFDLSLVDYDKSLPSYQVFDGFTWNANFINKIMDIYEQIDPNIKFNFVTNDFCWDNVTKNHSTNTEWAKLQIRMFKKMDKFYLLSDGAYSYVDYCENYCDFVKNSEYFNSKKQKQIWEKITSLPESEALQYYSSIDPRIFLNNEKYFHHFQLSTKITSSPYYLDNDLLTKDSTIKPSYPWIIPDTYKKILTVDTAYNNYLNSYLSFFQFYAEGKQQKFSDYIAYGTYKNFNSSKKNLIFLVPGALVDQKKASEELYVECRKILKKIQQNYPKENWNFLYSFHPRSIESDIKKALSRLFETESPEQWPDNTLVIDNHNPFEYLLVVDEYLASKDPNKVYHLIDPNKLSEEKPSGIMTGFDLCSTCYYAAISIFENEYSKDPSLAQKIIQNDAFYITRKFGIPNGYNVDGKDYGEENKAQLIRYCKALHQVGEFVDPDTFEYFN